VTTPYRMATLTPPVDTSPPWWQRAWFRVARDDAAQRWQWARRAIGGRWSQLPGDGYSWRWVRTPVCLGPIVTRALGGEPVPVGVCFDERENNLMVDEEIGHFEFTAHECHCEVWP